MGITRDMPTTIFLHTETDNMQNSLGIKSSNLKTRLLLHFFVFLLHQMMMTADQISFPLPQILSLSFPLFSFLSPKVFLSIVLFPLCTHARSPNVDLIMVLLQARRLVYLSLFLSFPCTQGKKRPFSVRPDT